MKKTSQSLSIIPEERVAQAIFIVRGQKVMLDSDLAKLYGVSTKRLNEQVNRNKKRFPVDFVFRLSRQEVDSLNRSQFATGSQKHRDPRFTPLVFTEYGALMAANVLKSKRAVEMSVVVVRAFVKLRQMLSLNTQLAQKLKELENRVSAHDENIRDLVIAIRRLMTQPEPERNPIGFRMDQKNQSKKK